VFIKPIAFIGLANLEVNRLIWICGGCKAFVKSTGCGRTVSLGGDTLFICKETSEELEHCDIANIGREVS
jgi:hypothetical protein